MSLMLAAADRDFLRAYQLLLEEPFGEVLTAFDGAMALTMLAERRLDALVLDEDLPRVEHAALVTRANELKLPCVALLSRRVTGQTLKRQALANAYLTYPFAPQALMDALDDVLNKAARGERIGFAGAVLDEAAFTLGDMRLTNAEIDACRALAAGKALKGDDGALADAIGAKLRLAGSAQTVKYIAGEGFRLVKQDE